MLIRFNMEKENFYSSIFSMMDVFMEKYHNYYICTNNENNCEYENESENESDNENKNEIIKEECINYTKQLHSYLIENCNFIIITKDLHKFIDKHIDKTQDLNFVMIAIKFLFQRSFFEININTNYEFLSQPNKNIFHINLSQILFNKIILAQKYVDEEVDLNDRKDILEVLIKDDINMLNKIYLHIKNIPELEKSKENLMEFLCQYDLEDIYINDINYLVEIDN